MNIREQMKSIKASANAKYRFSVYVLMEICPQQWRFGVFFLYFDDRDTLPCSLPAIAERHRGTTEGLEITWKQRPEPKDNRN